MDAIGIRATLSFDATDLNKAVQVFAIAQLGNTLLVRTGSGQFIPWSGGEIPYLTITAGSSPYVLNVASGLSPLDLPAFTVFVGYGLNWDEMLQAQRFKQVFPVDDGREVLPAFPLPATPRAQKYADDVLTDLNLRLKTFDLTDPNLGSNTEFLRTAALHDQVTRARATQLLNEERILRDAAQTGQLALGSGESVSVPLDPSGQLPEYCSGMVVCTRFYDPASGDTHLTLTNTTSAAGTSSGTTTPAKTSLPTASLDLVGLARGESPRYIRLVQCMPWAASCTNVTGLPSGGLGPGWDALTSAVASQATSMLSTCARYIEGVYRSQATPTYGSGDAAELTGRYMPVSRTYYLTCREIAFVWTYTTGVLYEAQISVDNYGTRPTAIASALTTYADTKRLSLQKLAANLVVGQIPYLNVVNSGVKCLFGTSGVDMLINTFSRTINPTGCRQAALQLATSMLPVLKTIPIPGTNGTSLTMASGISLAVVDGVEDFWSRSSYAITTSNARYGLVRP